MHPRTKSPCYVPQFLPTKRVLTMNDHSLQPKQSLLCTIMPSKTKESSQGITRHYIKRVLALSQSFIHKSLIHSGETGHVSPNYSFVISCKDFTLNLYKVLHRRHESIHSGWTIHVSSNYSFVRMPCQFNARMLLLTSTK